MDQISVNVLWMVLRMDRIYWISILPLHFVKIIPFAMRYMTAAVMALIGIAFASKAPHSGPAAPVVFINSAQGPQQVLKSLFLNLQL